MSVYKYDTATSLRAVTPDDDVDLPDGVCQALYIDAVGDVELIAENDTSALTLTAVPAGTTLLIRVKRILEGTTATVIALY